jgi:ribose 1,5-bisphosphokinase PhnN
MIDLAWARSLRAVRALPTTAFDTLVVVGPSGAGKTTLVDAVRDASLPAVDVPLRYVTRPQRASEVARETIHLSPAQFEQQVREGSIVIHWTRHLAGQPIRYGFAPVRPGSLAVLSANSAILSPDAALQPATALSRALVLGVEAPRSVREARLSRRSADVPPAELAYRLAHDDDPQVHVTIENHGALEPIARAEIVTLVARMRAERD